ncbi:MAG: glycosyltransferase [Burkholderiales bacterium]|nr:MAG: glycosyltransferase [Burkholderiales bacterium]
MKLAVLTHYITSYRISTFVALKRKVEHLTLLLSSDLSDPKLRDTGIDVRVLPSVLIPRKRRHPNGFVETYSVHVPYGVIGALRSIRPDAIHAHELGLRTLWATGYSAMSGTPMVIHADLSEETEKKWGGGRTMLRKAILARTDRVAVNGASGARYIEGLGYPSDRIDRLPFATDVEKFSSVRPLWRDDGVRRLLYVGRLIELKGLERFIEVLGRYLADRPQLRAELTLVGSGDRVPTIQAVPRPANLELRMPGAIPYEQLGTFYGQADTFVLPTLGDTWGLVVNESMSAGLPVLGSTLAQASLEMIRDGETGWLYDPRSDEQMSAAIGRFFDTPVPTLARMGEQARAVALEITPDRVAQSFVDSCEAALRARALLRQPASRVR